MKKHFFIFIIFILLVSLVFFFFLNKEKRLKVSFLNIGQGDSILIRSPYGQNILIDGGPDDRVVYELGRLLPFYDKTIDLMILTHPHADHITGLVEVIDRYNVGNILYTGVVHNSPVYLEWLSRIRENNIELKIVQNKQRINFGDDLYLDVMWPREDLINKEVSSLNNSSIVARLMYGQTKFLFTGDAEKEVEQRLIDIGENIQADVLKIGHHGSETSSSEDFIKAVSPEVAVISYGEDNQFGFPSALTMETLSHNDIKIFNTLDTVSFLSNKEKIFLDK